MANWLSAAGRGITSLFRPNLSPRYSDGWQASLPGMGGTPSGSPSGLATLNAGARILVGQLTATPMLEFSGAQEQPNGKAIKAIKNTPAAHWESAFYNLVYSGNGWLRIVRNQAGEAVSLEHIQDHRMSANLVDYQVIYLCDGQVINYDDYIHLMTRNTYSAYVGVSLFETHSTSLAAVMATWSIYQQLQSNGSFAEQYLATDAALNKEQVMRLREVFAEQTANKNGGAGGTVILSNGLKPIVTKTLPSALEMDSIKALEFTTAEMARCLGIPLDMLGVKDSVSYNSSIESTRQFYRATLKPLMHRVENELSKKLQSDIRYDNGDIVLGSGVERSETLSKLMYSGIISLNEARATIGYSAIKDGDINGLPANQLPLNNWLENGLAKPAPDGTPANPSQMAPTTPKKSLKVWRDQRGL